MTHACFSGLLFMPCCKLWKLCRPQTIIKYVMSMAFSVTIIWYLRPPCVNLLRLGVPQGATYIEIWSKYSIFYTRKIIWYIVAKCQPFCVCLNVLQVNTLRLRQNGHRFADDTFKCIFVYENVWIPFKISLKFVPKGPINNIPALVQIMAWRRPSDKPLSAPIMVRLPTHICVTRPQWVNDSLMSLACGVHKLPQADMLCKKYGLQSTWWHETEVFVINLFKYQFFGTRSPVCQQMVWHPTVPGHQESQYWLLRYICTEKISVHDLFVALQSLLQCSDVTWVSFHVK